MNVFTPVSVNLPLPLLVRAKLFPLCGTGIAVELTENWAELAPRLPEKVVSVEPLMVKVAAADGIAVDNLLDPQVCPGVR